MNTTVDLLLSNAIVAAWLALLVCGIGAFRPRPAVMHALWLIVLLKFVTPPLIRFQPLSATMRTAVVEPTTEVFSSMWAAWFLDDTASETATSAGAVDASFASVEDPIAYDAPLDWNDADPVASVSTQSEGIVIEAGITERVATWLPRVLMATWAAGSAAWFVLAGVRLARFRRQLGHTRVAGEPLQHIAADVAERLGLGARPLIRLSDANVSPMLITYRGQGLVLLPQKLMDSLSPPQQAAIIAHELAHFRRRDHWVRWLEFVVMGLYWWYPVAWLARRQLEQAEESCCDAWVLRVFPNQAKGYAQALLATVDFLSDVRAPVPAGASGFGRVHSLQRRLEMILQRTWRPDLSWAARILLIAVAVAILPWTPRAFSQVAATPLAQEPVAAAQKKDNADTTSASGTTSSQIAAAPLAQEPVAAAQKRDNVDTTSTSGTSSPLIAAPPAQAPQETPPLVAGERSEIVFTKKRTLTTEERLDRLEGMLTQVLTEMRKPSVSGSLGQPKQWPMNSLQRRPGSQVNKGSSSTGTSTGIAADPNPDPTPGKRQAVARIAESGKAPMTETWSKQGVTSESDIKAKLLDLEYEIQSLELQLRRAQAQRELIQNQIKTAAPDPTKP